MRKRHLYIVPAFLVFFILALLIPPAQGESPTFILFKRALKTSPNLLATQGREEAILEQEIEKRKGWPQISFETSFTLYDSHQEDTYRDQEFLTTVDLDLFGKHKRQAKALEMAQSIAQERQRLEKWHLFQQVARSYYRLVVSWHKEHLARMRVNRSLDLYQRTKKLVEKGALPEANLVMAEGELQEARLELEKASKERKLALAQMRMWIPGFEMKSTLLEVPDPSPVKVDQNAFLKVLIHFSPQMRSLEATKEKVLREAQAERLSFLPDLKLQGGYVVHREENDTGDYWMWSAGISLPLFDGGVRKRKVKLKELKAEEIEFQMASLKRALALKARTLITSLKSQYESWGLLKREAELYRGLAQKMFKAYSFGGISIEELIRTTRKAREKELKLTEISCRYNYTRDMIGYIQQEGGKK